MKQYILVNLNRCKQGPLDFRSSGPVWISDRVIHVELLEKSLTRTVPLSNRDQWGLVYCRLSTCSETVGKARLPLALLPLFERRIISQTAWPVIEPSTPPPPSLPLHNSPSANRVPCFPTASLASNSPAPSKLPKIKWTE